MLAATWLRSIEPSRSLTNGGADLNHLMYVLLVHLIRSSPQPFGSQRQDGTTCQSRRRRRRTRSRGRHQPDARPWRVGVRRSIGCDTSGARVRPARTVPTLRIRASGRAWVGAPSRAREPDCGDGCHHRISTPGNVVLSMISKSEGTSKSVATGSVRMMCRSSNDVSPSIGFTSRLLTSVFN